MDNDTLDRLRDALRPEDGNTLVLAIVAGVAVQLAFLLLTRAVSSVFRIVRWLLATGASLATILYVLNRGAPSSLDRDRLERWVDDARRLIGV